MTWNRIAVEGQTGQSGIAGPVPQITRIPAVLCACVLPIALMMGGCATGGAPQEQNYILEAARQGPPVPNPIDASLQVHRFNVDTAFATKNLIYRLGELKYEADYYRHFLIAPGTMITEQTRDWLADAGLFRRVLLPGSRITPDYTLEANVTALYGDFSDEPAPTAVMEIRFFLVEEADGRDSVAFAKTYRVATPVPNRTAEVFAAALTESFKAILTHLETDLPKALAQADAAGNVSQP